MWTEENINIPLENFDRAWNFWFSKILKPLLKFFEGSESFLFCYFAQLFQNSRVLVFSDKIFLKKVYVKFRVTIVVECVLNYDQIPFELNNFHPADSIIDYKYFYWILWEKKNFSIFFSDKNAQKKVRGRKWKKFWRL